MKGKTYHFQLPISIVNCKDTYHIGDTIRVVISYNPKAILNSANNSTEDLSQMHINPTFIVHKIDTADVNLFSKGLNYFKVFCPTINGCNFSYTETSIFYNVNSHYKLANLILDTVKLIPLQKGLFQVDVDLRYPQYRGETFPGKCSRSSYIFEWNYDNKYSNEQLTQYVQYCKIEGMKKYLMNNDLQVLSFGVLVK